jgi:MFS family permease
MFKNNRNLVIIAIIAVVNALGYGIIIPILYTYSQRFGLTDFQNGLLFSVFSLAQFISTPIIGRLSDKYGRRPLLIFSLLGTAISFIMMAFAQSGVMLFLARALDGITAGNIPVASAVISDTTQAKDRSKGFAIIGASFGFGFVFGPAISAVTIGLGSAIPFLIAAAVTIVAVVLTFLFLPETNKHEKEVAHGKLFDFKKLVMSVTDEAVGTTLLLTLIYAISFSVYLYAFQPFSVKVLGMSPTMISITFTAIGAVGLVAQAFAIPQLLKRTSEQKLLLYSLYSMVVTFTLMFFSRNIPFFIIVSGVHSFANAFVNPIIQAFLSKEVDAKSQGTIMGINASYLSIGMIIGPVIGGAIATFSIEAPFLAAGACIGSGIYLAYKIMQRHAKQVHTF